MFNSENLQEKWQSVLQHPDLPEIADNYKRVVTSVILENQEKALKEDAAFLSEGRTCNNTASASNWDPILISLVRRAMPNLIAYDICAVQPMTETNWTYLRNEIKNQFSGGDEALFNEGSILISLVQVLMLVLTLPS